MIQKIKTDDVVKGMSLDDILIHEPKYTFFEKIGNFFWYRWRYRWHRIKDAYYACKQRLLRKHHIVKTKLNPWGWHDTDERLLHASMELLIQFIKNEDPFEVVDWDHTKEFRDVAKTIKEIEKWWKNYPNRLKEIDKVTNTWYKLNCKKDKKQNEYFKNINKLEKKLQDEEQKMLKKLIDIRQYLWT